MVFKRRSPRSYLRILWESVFPKGGWTRAFHYVRHRVRRLPDSSQNIARGVFAGVAVSFTPLFGLHFFISMLIAKLMRGNMLAALLATFFGNPVTFPFIAFTSLKFGHLILGTTFDETRHMSLLGKFSGAWLDLKHNFFAMFTDATAHWDRLATFNNEIFLPYLIGGIAPGIAAGLIAYYLSEPVIAAYQKRRRKKLAHRMEKLRAKLQARIAKEPGKG